MTQDCSTSSSLKRLPKGLRIIYPSPSLLKEPERVSPSNAPVSVQSGCSSCTQSSALSTALEQPLATGTMERASAPAPYGALEHASRQDSGNLPWGYVYIPHGRVERFLELIEYIAAQGEFTPPTFVHRSPRRDKKSSPKSPKKKPQSAPRSNTSSDNPEQLDPLTVSGLVFLQGETRELERFLMDNFPMIYLVKDCATNRPASIPQSQMKPFMDLMKSNPYEITLLRDSLEKFAENRVKLRLLTGPFAGHEGYIVRIHRDRQLVMQLGGITIALRGVHRETFEVVSP